MKTGDIIPVSVASNILWIIFFYVGNFLAFNNCVAEWSWVPGMSRGYHLWHSQPLDRVTSPWLANPRPPTMSPHANGARRHGGKRMIKRLNEENGSHENTVLSTWRWCKQGWPRLNQTTDRWPRSRSLLLTLLNKYLFNLIKNTICSWRERAPCLMRNTTEKPHLRSGQKKCVETYFAKLNLVTFLLRLWAFVKVKLKVVKIRWQRVAFKLLLSL